MNKEIEDLFVADVDERRDHPNYGTAAYRLLRERDASRREHVERLIEFGQLKEPLDYYRAAWILNHGETLDEILKAHTLASKALELGVSDARWLTAATYDRWLMCQGRTQKFGTQIVPDGERYRVWDVEPGTTDVERAAWDVPSLAEMQRRAEDVAGNEAMPPMEEAPAWLKSALLRWHTKPGHTE